MTFDEIKEEAKVIMMEGLLASDIDEWVKKYFSNGKLFEGKTEKEVNAMSDIMSIVEKCYKKELSDQQAKDEIERLKNSYIWKESYND